MKNKPFTANCIAEDGTSWAIYFMVDTFEQAEHIVEVLGLITDEAGVCKMVEIIDMEIN